MLILEMQPDCVPRLAGGRHEIPVAGSGRPALDDAQAQNEGKHHVHHFIPVDVCRLLCRL
jgi:hypothetical protein